MNHKEKLIYEALKTTGHFAFIHPNDHDIYVVVKGGMLVINSIKPLSESSDEEINELIQLALK